MLEPSPPTAAARRRHLLPTGVEVLVDLDVRVRFDDQDLAGIIQETETRGDRDSISSSSSSRKTGDTAVRKMAVTGYFDSNFYHDLLGSIEPSFSQVADPPSVAFLSLKISSLPNKYLRRSSWMSGIQSRHQSCFLLSVVARHGDCKTFFYLVYDTLANSIAIVPPAPYFGCMSCGVTILCRGSRKQGYDYVLACLRLRIDSQSDLPTNKGTLLTWWGSLGVSGQPAAGQWNKREKEVLLPLPLDAYTATGIPYCSSFPDMAFAIGSTALCWVDLVKGVLIYRIDEQKFHFITLPEDCITKRGEGRSPKEYRSMCCMQGQGGQMMLKIVSMEGYNQEGTPLSEVTLKTWSLVDPLCPRGSVWTKGKLYFRLGDLFDNPVYKDKLKLQPLLPTYPIISTVKDDAIYLTFIDVELNHQLHTGKLIGVHVLSVDMFSHGVVSVVKGPDNGYPEMMTFIQQPQTEEGTRG